MLPKLLRLSLLIFILLILAASFVSYQFFKKPLLTHPPATSVIIAPGSSLSSIAKQLNAQGLMPYPRLFVRWALLKHDEHLLKAGEYQIDPGMTAPQLLNNMVTGNVILHKITFIEGWRFSDIRQALDQNPFIEHTITHLSDAEVMKRLASKHKSPEGLFFPETYLFTRNDKDLDILQMAYNKMKDIISFQWKARAADLAYHTPYQALIVASMIEKETAYPEDRAKVSGVINRRLHKGMLLQIDATIFYGLHEPMTYKLTKIDLQKDTPYNTYTHLALPPTPICMPSEESVYAALHPDTGDSLYYVARGDGSSEFSASYVKHQKAVEQYIIKSSVAPAPALPTQDVKVP